MFDIVPDPFITRTVYVPGVERVTGATSIVADLVVSPLFGTLQPIMQPGPEITIVAEAGSKPLPLMVSMNCCIRMGGLGDMLMLVMLGVGAAFTTNACAFESVPSDPLRTATVNDPAVARVNGPAARAAVLVVSAAFASTQELGVGQPGPWKTTSTVVGSKFVPLMSTVND